MYMAAYRLYGMGHTFSYQEVSSFDEILGLTKDSSFGGAAISFPFKQEAFNACSLRSPHASVTGSVNTLLPLRQLLGDKSTSLSEQANHRNKAGPVIGLYGDNTDWEGLYKNVLRKLSPRNLAMRARSTGLVLGAGGSARSSIYALLRLGCQTVYVHNRTYDKAVKVADHFNDWITSREDTDAKQSVVVLHSGSSPWPQDAALPLVIVACVPTTTVLFDGRAGGRFELPEEWLNSGSGGVVANFSYNPPNTPLLEQVRRLREKKERPWAIVTGVDIVYEQALLQFEQMTGYRAPRATMRKALAD
jgi:shikimate 5-dehydrogenase